MRTIINWQIFTHQHENCIWINTQLKKCSPLPQVIECIWKKWSVRKLSAGFHGLHWFLIVFNFPRLKTWEWDEATIVKVLPTCARLGAVHIGQWIHSNTESNGRYGKVVCGEWLVRYFNQCGIKVIPRKKCRFSECYLQK